MFHYTRLNLCHFDDTILNLFSFYTIYSFNLSCFDLFGVDGDSGQNLDIKHCIIHNQCSSKEVIRTNILSVGTFYF